MTGYLASLRNFLIAATAFLAALALPAQKPSYVLVSSPFAVESATGIPGKVLKPGSYTIEIVDSLNDRYILRITNSEGKPEATFIGLRSSEVASVAANHPGLVFWFGSPRGESAVRGFAYANGPTLEFVYSKVEAVALAKLNSNSVPAIDPESEIRKTDPKLTDEDREVVTLWMLNSIRIGKDHATPAIAARRFEAQPEATQATATIPSVTAKSKTYQIAENDPLPNQFLGRVSKVKRQPIAKRLPQTASPLPLLLLLSLFSICVGEGLRRLSCRTSLS